MGTRGTRIAALSGVLFVVLVVAASLVGGSTPDSDAEGSTVQAFYLAHKGRQNGGALLTILAVIVGLFFYGYLRAYFRRSPGTEWLASVSFGGAIVFAASGALGAGTTFSLTDAPGRLSPAALQALNVVQNDLTWPMMCAGLAVFYLAITFAIFKSRALPIWIAWVSLLLGLVAASLILGFFSFLATGLWVLYVSILLAKRNPSLTDDSGARPAESRVPVPV